MLLVGWREKFTDKVKVFDRAKIGEIFINDFF